MQRVAWRLVVMLWAANTGLALGPPRSNGYADFSGTVIVSLPHKMFVDIPNRIIIQSDNPILKVTINMTIYKFLTLNAGLTTFDQLDGNKSAIEEKYTYDLMYCVPIELKPGSHFNLQIVYFHCPSKNCRNGDRLIQKSVTKSVQLVQQFTVIMGETDKPLYRPGEEVRFRLIALTNRHILPHSESPTWPTYEAVGEFSEEQTLRRIEPTEREKRMRAPHFDSIEVRDPHSNIVYQWKHVKSSDALHLAFKLISDAKEGEWKIEVHVRHQKEVMPFTVRHYILPRFRAHLKLPDGIEPTDPDVKFGICAAYANGPFIRGTFDAQICICDGSVLERQQVEGKMFSKNKCISSYNTIMRTCMRTTGILDGASCASFAVNMLQLVNNESVRWNERIGVFVEAVEEGTTSSVFTSEVTKFRRWKEPQIDLILPSNYRNGLPLVGQVVYKNSVNATGDALEVVVNEILDACYYGLGTIDERQINLIKIPVKPGLETYDFTIPPLDLENPIRVTVRQVRGVDYPGENLLPPTGIRRFNPPRLNLRATKRLHLWDDEKGFAIQVILMNATSITCPGNVRLQILSNRALPKSTTLALQFLSRGRLAMKKLKLKVDYLCTPKKNEVEHYNYSEGGDSRCHEFVYDGNGCQGDGMNAGSGWCSTMPGEKDAPPGKKANHEERRNAVSVPRKTFFKYKATLELNGESGPEFRAVAYVFRGNQMASDYIKIGGLQGCSSPMMAETKHKGGFQFNKRFAVPGENVSIFLKLVPGKEDNVDAANLCLLSITDTSSKQFGLADFHRIDLDSFSALLTGDQVYGSEAEVRGTKDAYRAAGMDFIPISPISKMQTPRHCPRMIYPTYAASRIPPMGRIGPMGSPGVHRSEFVIGDTIHHRKQNSVVIPRIRDFFPEVWLFETAKLTNASLTKSLTVPDALTKWEANAVCLTVRRGLWMPMKKSQLTVWMPFFVEFTPPLMARRGEVLHLRISVFVHPEINTSATMVVMKTGTKAAHDLVIGAENGGGGEGVPRTCYEVEVAMETDQRDWQVVGASTFTTCICMGDLKKTFYPTLRPLRIGHLNVTAKAVARRGNWKCSDDGDVFGDWRQAPEALTVTDAARRSVRVIAEGVEKYFTLGGAFCAFKGLSRKKQKMTISLPDKHIVGGSLRSYVAVSGNVVGRAFANLDSLIQMPTGCGEQNLVKVAPSVYVLRHLLFNGQDITSSKVKNSRYDHVIRKAIAFILTGFKNQLNYRHPNNGAFSVFGPRYGANGSTWLTAYVFEVFSEAEKLPIVSVAGQPLDAYATLSSAFEFLLSQQRTSADGCFEEASAHFLPWVQNSNKVENRLQLTAHVLAALGSASTALQNNKGEEYRDCVRSAIRCIESTAQRQNFFRWPTLLLAKVVFATKTFRHEVSPSLREAMVNELMRRSKLKSTISGPLRWWPESASPVTTGSHLTKVLSLETTAYALLALSPTDLPREDQLATLKWILQRQNEKGGFYSTKDTVIALRALTQSADTFPSPVQTTLVAVKSIPRSLVNVQVEISNENLLDVRTFEIGVHNQSDISCLRVSIESPKQVCVSVYFTAIYNYPQPRSQSDAYEIKTFIDQGGGGATVACTTALTTLCLRSARAQPTGMLLMIMQLPSGWTVTMSELEKVPLNAKLKKIEFNFEKQEVSAYFNGFLINDNDWERCYTVPLHQRTFVQDAKPGLVTARDYYNPQETIEVPLQLNLCQLYWEHKREEVIAGNSSHIVTANVATTVAPITGFKPVCPECKNINHMGLLDRLNRSLCLHDLSLYIFKTHNATNRTAVPGLLYTFGNGNHPAPWNTTLNILRSCECKAASKKIFGLLGEHIQPGTLNVDLVGREMVIFEDLVKLVPKFKRLLETKTNGRNKTEQKLWCTSSTRFFALLQKLSNH